MRFSTSVIKREQVSLTGSAFTAFTVPTGAKLLVVIFPTTVVSLTLKGVTGDTGVTIQPATNSALLPLVLPLGATPSVGMANGSVSAQTVELVWL